MYDYTFKMIKLIIVHRELPPYSELGRQRTVESYPSFESMLHFTCNDAYKTSKIYEFNCCRYHITVLVYNLKNQIDNKLKFNSYNEFKSFCLDHIKK